MSNVEANFFAEKLKEYLRELEKSNVDGVVALFSADAKIYSPLLGWVSPQPFYSKLADASGNSTITLLDIFQSTEGNRTASAFFRYDWVLRDGSKVSFECVDVFDFNDAGLIEKLTIIYDTHRIRGDLGDRFA